MIIDSLTHATPDGKWFSTSFDASEFRLLSEMDRNGVEKSVVVALADYIHNDFVRKICSQHSDRLIPGAAINPASFKSPHEVKKEVQRILTDNQFAVLKLHPRLNRYDVLDDNCLAVFETLTQLNSGVCIWLDTLLYYKGASLRKHPVVALHDIAGRFPELKFLFLHSCGPDILRLAEAVRDCPNVYLDISYSIYRYQKSSVELDIKFLLRNFEQRMVFGSDFPEVSISDALDIFRSLSTDLEQDAKDYVLFKNIKKILDL